MGGNRALLKQGRDATLCIDTAADQNALYRMA